MDPVALQMLADLGLHRRDEVSAPEERNDRGVFNLRAQAEVQAEVQARSTQHNRVGSSESDSDAAKLRKWNNQDTFDRDEVTGRLQNYFSGQGHRAELRRTLGVQRTNGQRDDERESADYRFGEERRLHLQQHSAGGSGRNSSGGHFANGPATPGNFSGGHAFSRSGRPPPITRTENHARAPSPRAAGTVKFLPSGQRIVQGTGGTRTFVNPGAQAAAAMRAAGAQMHHARQPAPPTPAPLAIVTAQPPARVPTQSTAPNSPSISSPRSKARPRARAHGPRRISAASSSASIASSIASNQRAEEYMREKKDKNKALWFAANPGDECDKWIAANPHLRELLGKATEFLIKEIMELINKNNERDALVYLETHPDRVWMFQAAVKARDQVEQKTNAQIEEHCIANPDNLPFIRAAKVTFAPKTPESTRQSTPESRPATNDGDGDSSRMEIDTSAPVVPIVQAVTGLGSFLTTFYDMAGKLLGDWSFDVNAPVHVKVDVASAASYYDPRQLINSIEALAQSMQCKRENVQGAKMADDGLWEEEDEEL